MVSKAILKNQALDGEPLEAIYAPEKGMNLISYRKGKVNVIDQNMLPLFEKWCSSLGALIGPHFQEQLSPPPVPSDHPPFPHIALMKAQGKGDLFPNGIARYVPWSYIQSETQIQAELKGSDLYHGFPLKVFEGQDFHMKYMARLLSEGLFISLSIRSERPSLVGLHYAYAFSGKGNLQGEVQNTYQKEKTWKELPPSWLDEQKTHLTLPLTQRADFGFLPALKHQTDHAYHLNLNTESYSLHFEYNTASDSEISFHLFREENGTSVYITPLSAQLPLFPKLKESTLEVKLGIFSQTGK